MAAACTLGLDFGTNSVRALVADVSDGTELGTWVHDYARGEAGILLSSDPNLARQHPADYLEGTAAAVRGALENARQGDSAFDPARVIGIGVATTGSTPIPVDAGMIPLGLKPEFEEQPAAMAWLWKDHTAHAEAEEITALAGRIRPQYLARCGGIYSSEWFFSKILHCLRSAPQVFAAADSWVELADFVPAVLCGRRSPAEVVRGVCAAGHKAMYAEAWKGLPDGEFLGQLAPELAELRTRLYARALTSAECAGKLCEEWAGRLGLSAGIPVAAGAFDAHLGAVGSGIAPGVLVKIMGTSCCDMMVAPGDGPLDDIPGLCGIVPGSILPGYYGLEAGQSAFGDIYNWFVSCIRPGGEEAGSHQALSAAAARLRPGESGLVALDWNNGNRTVLVDQRLTGMLVGQTLHTDGPEIYRALIESTAFGALTIMNRFEEYGVKVGEVVGCGGIAEKSELVMQILADVTGRPINVARSAQACALGACVAGAVVAGEKAGGYPDFPAAQERMTGRKPRVYTPSAEARPVYERLYRVYRRLHDAFGTRSADADLYDVMKDLIEIRTAARGAG